MTKLVCISSFLCVLYLQWGVEGQEQTADKCKGVVCPRGRMCLSREENGSFTTCDCPSSCPAAVNQTVCTFYNKQFDSRCEMHKYACAHELTMKVKNEGICGTNAGPYVCTDASMFQFPSRYLEWIMVAHAKSFDPTYMIDPDARALSALTEEERKQVLSWEFESIDRNDNDLLDNEEIQAIFDDVLRYEPCIYGFLLSCDLNGRSGIGSREWDSCFPLTAQSIKSQPAEVKNRYMIRRTLSTSFSSNTASNQRIGTGLQSK